MHLSVKVVESGAKAGEEQQTKSKSIALASEAEKDAFRSSPPSLPGDGDPCPGLLGESSHGTAGEETGCRGRPRASCVALAGGLILNHQQQAIPGEDLRLRPPARTASPYQPQWTTGRIRYTEASHNLLTTGSQRKLILPPLAGAWKLRREGKGSCLLFNPHSEQANSRSFTNDCPWICGCPRLFPDAPFGTFSSSGACHHLQGIFFSSHLTFLFLPTQLT